MNFFTVPNLSCSRPKGPSGPRLCLAAACLQISRSSRAGTLVHATGPGGGQASAKPRDSGGSPTWVVIVQSGRRNLTIQALQKANDMPVEKLSRTKKEELANLTRNLRKKLG